MRNSRLLAVLLAAPLAVAVGQTAATQDAEPVPAPAPRYSPEKLAKLRAALTAQIAVRDAGEGAMRAPTPAEARALAGAPAESGEAFALTGGGFALRADASQLSFLVAETSEDGTVQLTHSSHSPAAKANAKEGAHAR